MAAFRRPSANADETIVLSVFELHEFVRFPVLDIYHVHKEDGVHLVKKFMRKVVVGTFFAVKNEKKWRQKIWRL